MGGVFQDKKVLVRIVFGLVVGVIGLSMLMYLVPPQAPGTEGAASDTVAQVGDQSVTVADVREQLNQIEQSGQFPKQLEALYAQQILKQLVQQKEIEYEAKRLGIRVSDEEVSERIKLFLPTVINPDGSVAMDRYASEVQARARMSVPQFETLIRQGLLEEKFRRLVTDGISITPADLQDEFRYRNEKIKLDYVYIKPEDLEAKISPDEVEIKAAYERNQANYQVPERRVVRYGLLDMNQVRQSVQISEDELKAAYQQNLQKYEVPNRVHVAHILLRTAGKTDAEVEEVRKKAEDVLKQAKKGGKFEDLAKKYSEDPSKDKGGDLGWILQGQTVAEFEKAAFSLTKGSLSDLVRSQFGFHIIKVLDKESAHTKPFDEVKDSIRTPMVLQRVDKLENDAADQMASAVRRSNRTALDDLARQFHLNIAETRPVAMSDPLLELGNSKEIKEAIFHLQTGEVSQPIRTDRGYVIVTAQEVQKAHQGALAEIRDRVVADLKQQKSTEMARGKAEELSRRVKAGEKLQAAAKSLGFEAKTSDTFARTGSISSVASGRQLADAFGLKAGDAGAPLPLGANWLVYQVAAREEPNPADFEKQQKELTTEVLERKRGLAFQAFQKALEDRLKQEGKLKQMPDRLKGFGGA